MANYGYEELSTALPVQAVHLCVPLPHADKQIRVLDLDPVHSESPPIAQALHGRLRVISELAEHEYTALSYVWAQEDLGTLERENRLIIHCNDHLHEARLGRNCWSALWHLCKIKRPSTLIIWVDSICIDQKNDEEKEQQISLMCGIYRSAQTTYFWLGEATKNTDEAMDFLLRDRITMSTGGVGNIFLIVIKMFMYSITLKPYPHRSGLREIFGRQWIKRLWTLQECLLSQKGIVVCGEKVLPWASFVCALESIHYCHTHPWSLHFDGLYLPWLNLANLNRGLAENVWSSLGEASENLALPISNVSTHLECLKWAVRIYFIISVVSLPSNTYYTLLGLVYLICFYIFPYGPKKARLFFPRSQHSILEELRNREVRDPKDMYNGVVGILGDDASNTGESLYVVYRRLCTSLICKTGSLDVLLFTNTCADNNYCSWVINWNSTMPQLWGKAIYYMEKRKSRARDLVPDVWNIESGPPGGRGVRPDFDPTQEYLVRRYYGLKQWCLKKYQGAMPETRPWWIFRDQGESLCVYGLILTHISSHLAPTHADAEEARLHPLYRVLLSIPTWATTFISAKARWFLQKKADHHDVEMTRPQDTRSTAEVTNQQTERNMFISALYNAFSGMDKKDRRRAQKQLTALMIVATGERGLERELKMWWHTLQHTDAGNIQGRQWLENLMLTDKIRLNNLNLVMNILRKEGLSAVCCEANESLGSPGGLAFAGAAAQTRDAVALVSGVSFPLVLRPCGQGRFRLVGPIFLPGVMDGELKDKVRTIPLGEITLV